MKKSCFILFAALCSLLCAGEKAVSGRDMMGLKADTVPWITLPEDNWRYIGADDPAFAAPDFDDSKWARVRVNCTLAGQKFRKKVPAPYKPSRTHGWYRCHFTLPEGTPQNNFELRLGEVSAGDETFINGVRIGSYGLNPPVNGSSDRARRYFSSGTAPLLHAGDNVIAVRCKLGYKRGMHRGIVELRKLPELLVTGKLSHRSPGKTAVLRQLTAVAELNRFQPGEEVCCRPELILIAARKELPGMLSFQISRQGKTVWTKSLKQTLKTSFWNFPEPVALPVLPEGKYEAAVSFSAEGKTLWQLKTTLAIAPADLFNLKADPALAALDATPLPLTVDDASFGSFGPRNVDQKNRLFDDYSKFDTRGSTEFLTTFGPGLRGAQLAVSCVKPMPKPQELRRFSHSIGTQHDRFADAWSLGSVMAAGKKELPVPSTEKVRWTGRSVRYRYSSGGSFLMTASQLTPALVFEAENLGSMLFFRGDRATGAGAPARMYCEKQGKLQSAENIAQKVSYVVLSFENAAGYDEFNIPLLIAFETAPKRLSLLKDGLLVWFRGKESGRIFVMPLYGLTLQKPGMPEDALRQAQKWDRIVRLLPEDVTRTAKVDYAKDQLLFQDRYTWRGGKMPEDALLPLPPTLLLAQKGGMKIRCSRAAEDLELATMYGPFTAARGGASVTWAMDGMVHYVTEVRVVSDIADNPESRAAQQRLTATAEELLKGISQHPWANFQKKGGKGEIGGSEPGLSNLLIATQYLPQDLNEKIKAEIRRELPVSILNDDLQIEGRKPGKRGPINTKVTSPLSGKTFSMLSRHCRDNGIDCPCWEALRLSMYERIGRFCGADETLKKHWKQILTSYDPVVNSHDWANSVSWDSYGGLRVGNGFQENTIFHSGFIAFARLAHRFGMPELRDQAAYYALLQLAGSKSCASASTMAYLRRVRPILASGEIYPTLERLEAARPNHHLEFNERTGFYHVIIYADNHYYTHGFIMTHLPEIMRPFREQWGDFTTEHLNFKLENGLTLSHSQYPPVDHFLYLTATPPFAVEELVRLRLQPEFRAKLTPWQKLADDRAALENYGKVTYKKLW